VRGRPADGAEQAVLRDTLEKVQSEQAAL
jgi:hypothetical protein